MKGRCFWTITVPCEGVDFWEVFLNFLKNNVLAYAVEGIFNIKFKENFIVVELVHEVTGGVDCSFTLQGGAYLYLGRREEFMEPWDEGSQTDFSNKTVVGASYGNGPEVSVAFAKPVELGAIEKRPEVSRQLTICKVVD